MDCRLFFSLGHAASAFHFYHHWSHADAVQLTAEQTQAVLGYAYGQGIWFSYFLLLIWLIDVVQLWRNQDEAGSVEPRFCWNYFSYAVHAYAFFILFNGTVVFEEGLVRWGGIVGTLWILRMAWRFRRLTIFTARPTKVSG